MLKKSNSLALVGCLLLSPAAFTAAADEPPNRSGPPAGPPAGPPTVPTPEPSASGQGLSVTDWLAAANDLRVAAETAERVAEIVRSSIFHFSEASRHFDPLGMKATAETIARQNETIARQNEVIQDLLRAEINRLEAENDRLRQELRRPPRAGG